MIRRGLFCSKYLNSKTHGIVSVSVQFFGTFGDKTWNSKCLAVSCQVSNKETNIDSAKDALKMLESEIQAPEFYKKQLVELVSGTSVFLLINLGWFSLYLDILKSWYLDRSSKMALPSWTRLLTSIWELRFGSLCSIRLHKIPNLVTIWCGLWFETFFWLRVWMVFFRAELHCYSFQATGDEFRDELFYPRWVWQAQDVAEATEQRKKEHEELGIPTSWSFLVKPFVGLFGDRRFGSRGFLRWCPAMRMRRAC